MFKTEVTEMLGVKYPIIAGNMFNISKPKFVAACCNAGTLGIFNSAQYRTVPKLREAIRETKSLTDKPFAVNVNLFPMLKPVNQEDYIQCMIDEGVPVIETSGHEAPDKYVSMFKESGVIWMHKCVGVRYAKKAESIGADIVEVVGYENGGATGNLNIATLVLVPSVVDALNIPVIGGGGISDGRGLLAVLSLGAGAGLIGTRLLATQECPIHDDMKQAFINAKETDTVLVMKTLNATHRVWNNGAAQKILELEAMENTPAGQIFSLGAGAKAKKMYKYGELDMGMVSCGQGVGLAHDIPTVKELFDRIMKEAEDLVNKFHNS